MSPALLTADGTRIGIASSVATDGESPARTIATIVAMPTPTFTSTSGSLRANTVGPNSHMNGAVTYADTITR